MKKTISMLLATVLVASPALAYGPGPDNGKETPKLPALERSALSEALESAAREVVAENALTAPLQDADGVHSGKLVVGILLLAAGAGMIINGFDLKQDEPDLFGRKKDLDSVALIGGGGVFSVLGIFVIRSALRGEGF